MPTHAPISSLNGYNITMPANKALQFLYAWLAFHDTAARNKDVRRGVNETALLWNTHLAALQSSLFIVLGRLFDQDPRNHTLDRLIKEASQNPQIFSRQALAKRKKKDNPKAAWIKSYVRKAYIPTSGDFKRLNDFVGRKRKIYKKSYEKIRHKIFSHSALSPGSKINDLFAKTNIGELEKLVLSIRELHSAMLQLYMNGRKPLIKRTAYSISGIKRRLKSDPSYSNSVEAKIIKETDEVLLAISKQNVLQNDA